MFCNQLKLLREARNISMRRLAEDLNIPYTTYIHYEKGDNEPNNEVLVKLAVYFNVSVDYLLGIDTQQKENASTPIISPERLALQKSLELLSIKSLEEVDKFIDYLLWQEEQKR